MRPLDPRTTEDQLRTAIDAGDSGEIDRLGALLDSLDPPRSTPGLLASALWYASVGLHVFPLQPRSKQPYPKTHGLKDATTDAEQVRAWWAERPDSNVGIATGHLVDVVDIDGTVGVLSWAHTDFPDILGKVSTPRAGGNHLYVAAVPGRGNKAGILPGVDYRGLGGYVVAPPSVNDEGVPYAWYTPLQIDAGQVAA